MIALRAATADDANAVGAILSAFVDDTPWMPRIHTRAQDLAHSARMVDFGWVTVASRNGCVIGFSARNGADLNALYVAQDAQSQGAGAALLKQAQEQTDHLDLWTFQANTGAQRFYARHGFVETARSDGAENDEGLPDIRLEWRRKDT